jgi:hypothetical protein
MQGAEGGKVAKPTLEQLNVLESFLNACEEAAKPPPPPPPTPPPVMLHGLLGVYADPRPRPPSLLASALLRRSPETLGEVLGSEGVPPFESSERLGDDRASRIAQLERWLRQFPAFVWMGKQPAIRAGHDTFVRIQRRRKTSPKFADDLAPLRYWSFAVWAVQFLNAENKPPPKADQRQQAISAARKLIDIAATTTLLRDAGIDYSKHGGLLAALSQLQSLANVARRKRTDAHSADRKYIRALAWAATFHFDDAPPALVCELAALKVSNPDKVAITKQVSLYKKERASATNSAKV